MKVLCRLVSTLNGGWMLAWTLPPPCEHVWLHGPEQPLLCTAHMLSAPSHVACHTAQGGRHGRAVGSTLLLQPSQTSSTHWASITQLNHFIGLPVFTSTPSTHSLSHNHLSPQVHTSWQTNPKKHKTHYPDESNPYPKRINLRVNSPGSEAGTINSGGKSLEESNGLPQSKLKD